MAEMSISGDIEDLGTWPPLLADNECPHNSLPGDTPIRCGCWGSAVGIEMAVMAEGDAACVWPGAA